MRSQLLEHSSRKIQKGQVRQELDSYFEELMRISTIAGLEISVDTMHQYVAGSIALKTMMCMLSDGLERGAKVVYLDATKAIICFLERCHHRVHRHHCKLRSLASVLPPSDHHEDVEDLVLPQLSES